MLLFALFLCIAPGFAQQNNASFFTPDHPYIRYTGRIDFSNPKLPRFWQPGVYITIRFVGSYCEVVLNDEELWDKNHNYLEIVLDGKERRLQTTGKTDTIKLNEVLSEGEHTLVIVKNTEANIGYSEFAGIRCRNLLPPLEEPARKIEFIGNSITCGTGADVSAVACGKGEWHDQHNAYLSYGAITARSLNAKYHLSAVSGIGLMHSCCDMDILMPQVFDKISMRNNAITWDFSKFQPDVLMICLGQNDGRQDSAEFCIKYVRFVKQVRGYYPRATIILLTSPMADPSLAVYMKTMLTSIERQLNQAGDKKVTKYFFKKRYYHGCDTHPDLAEHRQIADELTAFIRQTMNWK